MTFLEDDLKSTAYFYPALHSFNIQPRTQFSSPTLLRSLSPRSFVSLPISKHPNDLQALKSSNVLYPFSASQYKSDVCATPKKQNNNRLYFKKFDKCSQQISPRRLSPSSNIKIINYGPIQVCCAKLTTKEKPILNKLKKLSPQRNNDIREIASKAQKQNIEQMIKSPTKTQTPQTRYFDKNEENSTLLNQTTTTFTNSSLQNQTINTINITVNRGEYQKCNKRVLSASSKFINLIQQNQTRNDKKIKKVKSVKIIEDGELNRYSYLWLLVVLCIGFVLISILIY